MDLNEYWKEKQRIFSNLAQIALIYIWFPISEINIKRSFGDYKNILNIKGSFNDYKNILNDCRHAL